MSRPTLKFALPVLLAFVALALAALGAWAGPPGSTAGLPALQGATDQAPAAAQTPAPPAKRPFLPRLPGQHGDDELPARGNQRRHAAL